MFFSTPRSPGSLSILRAFSNGLENLRTVIEAVSCCSCRMLAGGQCVLALCFVTSILPEGIHTGWRGDNRDFEWCKSLPWLWLKSWKFPRTRSFPAAVVYCALRSRLQGSYAFIFFGDDFATVVCETVATTLERSNSMPGDIV